MTMFSIDGTVNIIVSFNRLFFPIITIQDNITVLQLSKIMKAM